MATKKKTSSGSTPKAKKTVKRKMKRTMDEYKHNKLKSGRSGKKVKSRKQAIAIGLSEARRAGADIPKRKGSKKKASKRKTSKKT
jgi:hypothetical protein